MYKATGFSATLNITIKKLCYAKFGLVYHSKNKHK